MRLIVSDIPEEGLTHDFDLPVEIKDDLQKEAAHVTIKVRRLDDRVFFEGSASMSALFVCSRCLREFTSLLKVRFSEEYLPVPEAVAGAENKLADKEPGFSYYSNDEIEIDGLIREQLLLATPMKPLCKEDCCGICSNCGKDLNEGLCGCKNNRIDPRWMPLKKLKESLK